MQHTITYIARINQYGGQKMHTYPFYINIKTIIKLILLYIKLCDYFSEAVLPVSLVAKHPPFLPLQEFSIIKIICL